MPMAGRAPTSGHQEWQAHCRSVAPQAATSPSRQIASILSRVGAGVPLDEQDLVRLFRARGDEFSEVCAAADALRREASGDVISYVVCRNINYTNVCYFKCQFCAFSKGKLSENLRGRPVHAVDWTRSRGVRARPGIAARPKCACRVESSRVSPVRPISKSVLRFARPFPACTSTRSHLSKCIRARQRSVSRLASS